MINLRQIILSSRPVSWLNTAYPFAAGYIITTHDFSFELIVGTIYFLIPYNLLMYGVNDVFDYESDIKNPRKGGIEGAVIRKSQQKTILLSAAVANLPFLAVMFTWGTGAAKIALALIIFQVLAYSLPRLRFKEIPLLDSITSSSHFVGPLLYALVLTGWDYAFLPFVIAFFCWGMASHAFGSIQDIASDRAGKIESIGTYLGAQNTLLFSLLFYSACTVILLTKGLVGFLAGILCVIYIANLLPFLNINDENADSTNSGWRRFIWLNLFAGFCITMILITVY